MRYDYNGASVLFKAFRNQFTDPWELDTEDWRQARRDFLRAFTRRNDDRQQYIDLATERMNDECFIEYGNSKCIDFKLLEQCEKVINKMINF